MSASVDTTHRRRRILQFLVAILSLTLIVGVSMWESEERISPGELHPSHASVDALQGNIGCAECHGEVLQSMSNGCINCHEPIVIQLTARSGLHGMLDSDQAEACAQCHIEHTGGAIGLVTDSSFSLAGVTTSEEYQHEHVMGFALEGAHEELACEKCHTMAHAGQILPGDRRYLGLQQDCTACHSDDHNGSFGADCALCHDQAHAFDVAPLFSHSAEFSLVGGHSNRSCIACHEIDGSHSVGTLLAGSFDARTCTDCHTSPHHSEFLRAFKRLEGSTESASCEHCHKSIHNTFGRPAATMTASFHAATGFPLDSPHDSLDCSACHDSYDSETEVPPKSVDVRFAALYPGRASDNCRVCHDDPHKGEFDGNFSRGACLACHEQTHFAPSNFDLDMHAQTNFVLQGAHATVDCDACHVSSSVSGQYAPDATACADCHEDVHRSRFDGPKRPALRKEERGCARCHTSDEFSKVDWTVSDHNDWTDFPLIGAHSRVDCVGCHLPVQKQSPGHRSFGFAERDCSSCHADPHMGQFREKGTTDCSRCHNGVKSWGDPQFDHQRDSRLALDEHHRQLDCASCHRPVMINGARSVIRYKPLGTKCADCHGFQTQVGAVTP